MELAPGITCIGEREGGSLRTRGYVRAFLVEDGSDLTLVDTLGDSHPFLVLAAIRRLGRSITDLKRIWLTHAHFSHLCGLAALKRMSGATVASHEWEAGIISGERKAEHEQRDEGYYRVERAFGSFSRSLTLPKGVDPEGVTASFDRGVLEVRVPKPEERKPRRIEIAGASGQKTIEG